MKKIWAVSIVFSALLFFPGCASAGGGWFSGLFTAKVADKVQVAEKVTGVENAKVDAKAQLADKVQAGSGNEANQTSINQHVGGDLSNDSEVMKQYINSIKDGNSDLLKMTTKLYTKIINIFYWIIGGLLSLIVRYIVKDIKVTNRLLDARDREDLEDGDLLKQAYSKKEDKP